MSTQLDRLPEDVIAHDLVNGSISMRVDAQLYPLEAVYAAAYVFIDRCYVFLDRPAEGTIRVSLSPKRGTLEGDLGRDIVGEFANELLSCAWRAQIARDNRAIIEAVTASALAGARGMSHEEPQQAQPATPAPSLEELEAFDFSDEAFDDPLGIAMSWEDKYKKKAAAKAEPAPADAAVEASK